jgi:curved DNA-binding protein
MKYRDYYQILGVERVASDEEIRRAFRQQAMKYHPDRNMGDKKAEEKFKELNEAYEVLSNRERRRKYDHLGVSYQEWSQSSTSRRGNFNWEDWFSSQGSTQAARKPGRKTPKSTGESSSTGGYSDFFTSIFGATGKSAPADGVAPKYREASRKREVDSSVREKPSSEHHVTIKLEEAFHGAERTVQVERRSLTIKIPPGARTGTRVQMNKAGPVGSKGEKIDIYMVVSVEPHEKFSREGNDLNADITIDLYTALLGGQTPVETIDGKVFLTIPAGTQPGKKFRLAGQGMPHLRNPDKRGDMYVRVDVILPRITTPKQRELVETLKKLDNVKKQ